MVSAPMHEITGLSYIVVSEISHLVKLQEHSDFNFDEIQEICEEFLKEIPKKIKDETKIKRLKKYINKEFELENEIQITTSSNNNTEYNLENIPKYLFE